MISSRRRTDRGGLEIRRGHIRIPALQLFDHPARQAFQAELTADDLSSGPCELDGEAFDWGDRYPHPQYWTV